MAQGTEQNTEADVYSDWLKNAARQRNLTLSTSFMYKEGKYMHFATRLQMDGDAYDHAGVLQDLEDAWDAEHPDSKTHLFLMPTGA